MSTPLLAILPRNRNLAPGQRVQIIAGPLRGLRGSVTETADSLFVQIRLDIPGVCVRLAARQVAAEREQPPTD